MIATGAAVTEVTRAGDRVTGPFSSEVAVEETLRTLALALDARVEGSAASGFRLLPAD